LVAEVSKASSVSRTRWLILCTLAAIWCTAWPLFFLELTRGYPGILSMKGHAGAYEILEWGTGLPAWLVLAGLFVLIFGLGWMVAFSRRWLDPDRRSTRAVRWAFGSRSLNLLALVGAVLLPIAVVVFLVSPFFVLNRRTLSKPRLARWWVPAWPGWLAIVVSIAFIALKIAVNFVDSSITGSWGSGSLLTGAQWAIDFVAWLATTVAWLDASSFTRIWANFRMASRGTVWMAVLWQWLLGGYVSVCFLIPVFSFSALLIFVIPQYYEWSRVAHVPVSPALQLVWNSGEYLIKFGLYGPGCMLSLYVLLMLGRLLRESGIGDEGFAGVDDNNR
jgi:hypothetical protein